MGEGPTRDGPHQIVSIMVEDALRGEAPLVMEVRVDPPSMDPARPAPKLITGYQVLAFVDGGGWLVDGDAMFALEAGWAWRNRRASTFFKPRLNHDWAVAMDPYEDYVAFNLHEIMGADVRPGPLERPPTLTASDATLSPRPPSLALTGRPGAPTGPAPRPPGLPRSGHRSRGR